MTKNDPIWICKFNHAIDCGSAIPFCDNCGWNPYNVSLKCYRILKVLGVERYGHNYSANPDTDDVAQNLQGGREAR